MPLVKVADNWDALSDTEKVALFEAASYAQPEIEDLRKLGKFRVVTYSKDNEQAICSISATPKVQIVLPKDLLNIKQVEDINKITITQNKVDKNRVINKALLHFDNKYRDEYGTTWGANSGCSFVNDCKFGSNAVKFNGGTIQSQQNIDFGTSDWTIDFWQKSNSTQAQPYATFFCDSYYNVRLETRRIVLKSGDTTQADYQFTAPLSDDNWHHIAVVRKNGVFYVFQDGVKLKEITDAKTVSFHLRGIGHCPGSPSNTYLDGIMDEFSLVPYAKWTDNFTPPTAPYDNPPEVKPNDIRFAFTIDKNKYYTYKNSAWEEIQSNEIPTKGIVKEAVEAIPTEKWHELITEKDTKVISKLGIAYSIQQRYVDDTCNIDNLSLTISQKGKWRKMLPHSHYMVDFVDNETVEVTLNNAGSYKINYCLGG
jgi:hypothetical protein|nr:MAG TPA: Concanavalin A-like lectin/glucanase superfamily protein [Caudoviricetes sp.]